MNPGAASPGDGSPADRVWLADWRRWVAVLYAEVRAMAETDPVAAHAAWRAERERLFREHPQSPVPAAERSAFRARHFEYDPAWRFEVRLEADPAADSPGGGGHATTVMPAIALPNSGESTLEFSRLGSVTLPLPAGPRTLTVFWMAGYTGGLFLPFRDATNGQETYAAGRYLLDTAKSHDLGGDPAAGTLVIDANFATQPSCAFDPRWACPLAPPENRLDAAVRAGERLS